MDDATEIFIAFAVPILGALAAGGLIGFEREYRGRPAGLRTHLLVCLSSALLMVAAVHQVRWMGDTPHDVIRIDPVRMAHGILTGVGFLCGGVIFRQGLTVHGLTTAASLWTTSALGTLWGMGLYGLALAGTLVTLAVLGGLRWLDAHLPQLSLLDVTIRYSRGESLPEPEFLALVRELRLETSAISHRLVKDGTVVELGATLRGRNPDDPRTLAGRLCADPRVREFEILPRKD
jgi:putative Mg2+ transporter-C (MgtC) family protein